MGSQEIYGRPLAQVWIRSLQPPHQCSSANRLFQHGQEQNGAGYGTFPAPATHLREVGHSRKRIPTLRYSQWTTNWTTPTFSENDHRRKSLMEWRARQDLNL